MIATRKDPPQISRTASAADAAWTTVNPSASSARVISSRSVLISLTIRTEDIGDLTTQMDRDRTEGPKNPENPGDNTPRIVALCPLNGLHFPHAPYQVRARVARESRREFIASRSNAALRGVAPLVSS